MKCQICTDMQNKFKQTSVWATDRSPNSQYSGVVRHSQSAEPKTAYVAYEKQKIERLTPCISTEPEEDNDTLVSFDNCYTVY